MTDILFTLALLGAAVFSVRGAFRRRGKPLAAYLTGMAVGAFLGVFLVEPLALGLAVGLAGSGLAPQLSQALLLRVRGPRLPVEEPKE